MIKTKMSAKDSVTILIYAWGNDFSYRVERAEAVITHTRKMIGDCHAVIVCNHDFIPLIPDTEVQVCSNLIPGNIDSMSYDCIVNLWKRFDTEYVLIVQEDGYPIRKGIDEFIGKADFIGARVFRRNRQWLSTVTGMHPMNGGFSLRSRKICKKAASSYKLLRWLVKPGMKWFVEDVYYTMTATILPWYRYSLKWPTSKMIDEFAYDGFNGLFNKPKHIPFGVHGKTELSSEYTIKF